MVDFSVVVPVERLGDAEGVRNGEAALAAGDVAGAVYGEERGEDHEAGAERFEPQREPAVGGNVRVVRPQVALQLSRCRHGGRERERERRESRESSRFRGREEIAGRAHKT